MTGGEGETTYGQRAERKLVSKREKGIAEEGFIGKEEVAREHKQLEGRPSFLHVEVEKEKKRFFIKEKATRLTALKEGPSGRGQRWGRRRFLNRGKKKMLYRRKKELKNNEIVPSKEKEENYR